MQKEYNFFCDYYKYLTTVNKHGISNLYTLMLKSLKNILLNSLVPKAFVLINNFFFSLRFSNILIYFETNGRTDCNFPQNNRVLQTGIEKNYII